MKLSNDLIEYDRKLSLLSQIHFWKPQDLHISIIIHLFNFPYITDYVVIIFTYFHLINIGNRFQTLNYFWKCLPTELIPIRDEWTHSEIAMLVETIRLLHAKLCTILKLFNSSYGPLLLGFFICNFLDFIYIIYLMTYHEIDSSKMSLTQNIIKYIPMHLVNLQIIVFLMSIIIAASRITDKKNKIISILRLIRISKLPVALKIQIKMFMNQTSITELNDVNTWGFFNINLNLVISIMVILLTGFSTMLQMKKNPIILNIVNNTKINHENW
ncbi:uncharacterized protein LOC132918975 [Rhopalosiphum padi]|uniref:uncharacterized protein LOC132918975 n=1 Tax=Rhopalosiphum padi TaxID=40932 RepID=UPI00298E6EA1|nr:uncharacterized protein LOC132918975 [Rhopalosiphum padi]